ncbi:EpsG family protein [Tatumella ptyseos]|uniref:EpsG family protein n=1 Tax=Tatumella ptyseos TaxID=82987 RepID=UPI0026ECA104|nr:EpsG family protein [Tatumella ptyseos]WKX27172.1 EpsG family protein [Tatumella ptyseos]
MKISKCLPLSFLLTFIFPIAGFFLSLVSISKKGMNRFPFFLISFFYFCFLIKLPPYGDSYRRYLDYESFNQAAGVLNFLSGHPDIFYYLSIVVFKSLSIPYFILPAIYGAAMIYMLLCSLRNGSFIAGVEMSGKSKVVCFLLILSSFDIINFSLGLRFGLAIAMTVYGITTYYSGKKKKGLLALIIALTVHFSMLFVFLCFILSRFIKINKKQILLFSILSYFFSATFLPFILNQFSFLSIAQYALEGYVESDWANASQNLNTLGVFLLRNLLQLGVLFLFLLNKKEYKKIDDFISIFIPAIFLVSISFSAVQRYLVVCNLIVLSRILPCYYHLIFRKRLITLFLFLYILISGVVLNIYVQRIAIIWGGLWSGYYTTPITLLFYTNDDFRIYLQQVDYDGNWTQNKQGVGQ